MALLVPMIPLMDGAVAQPDARTGRGIRTFATDPRELVIDYLHLGVEWVHFQDLDGQRAGRPAHTCPVTEMAVHKEMVVSVEGGVKTWQDVRMYLGQAVDLVYLSGRDGWHGPFTGIGQREVERRVLYEVPVPAPLAQFPDRTVELIRPLLSFGVIPVLGGDLPLPELVRLGNYVGVELKKRVILRPEGVPDLATLRRGLGLTGGFVQAVMLSHAMLEPLGVGAAVAVALD
ncbi:MAG TPA: HisA/HisF-related TIM barrel protein, partial [bacterium]|nr:HisA/HisF-related TIM barrel protein [bacterium]